MTIDEWTSGCSGESLQLKYNLTPEEATNYVTRVKDRLGVEKKATFDLFITTLSSYNKGKLKKEEVVSQVEEILKDESDLLNEFKDMVVR